MSKQLVVSADDFGFSRAYSAGNIRVVTEGVATVLALMSNVEAATVMLRMLRCPFT